MFPAAVYHGLVPQIPATSSLQQDGLELWGPLLRTCKSCAWMPAAFNPARRPPTSLPARHGGTGDSSSELSRDMGLAGRERSLIIRIEPNGLRNKNQRTGGCGSEGISQSVTQSKAAWMQGPAHVTQPAHKQKSGPAAR